MSMLFVQQKILRIGKLKLYVLFSTAKVNAAPTVVRDGADYAQLKLINISSYKLFICMPKYKSA